MNIVGRKNMAQLPDRANNGIYPNSCIFFGRILRFHPTLEVVITIYDIDVKDIMT